MMVTQIYCKYFCFECLNFQNRRESEKVQLSMDCCPRNLGILEFTDLGVWELRNLKNSGVQEFTLPLLG